jgi:hypothetical protein
MLLKIFSVTLAAAMLLTFLAPPVIKLREISLGVVIAIGVAMMAYDLWDTLRERDIETEREDREHPGKGKAKAQGKAKGHGHAPGLNR